MRKIYFILFSLILGSGLFAAIPEAGQQYYIKNTEAGLYLKATDAGITVDYLLAGSEEFQFEFTASGEEGYYILSTHNGSRYFVRDQNDNWICYISDQIGEGESSLIKLTEAENNTFIISFKQNEPQGLGLDSREPGSTVYTDKQDGNAPWWILEEVPDVIELKVLSFTPEDQAVEVSHTDALKIAFNNLITLGNGALVTIQDADNNSVGGIVCEILETGNVLSIAHDQFDAETTYTVTVPVGTIKEYQEEIKWSFTTDQMAVTPEPGKVYKIKLEDTDTYFTVHEGDPESDHLWRNNTDNGQDNQKFVFEWKEGTTDKYALRVLSGGYLGYNEGGAPTTTTQPAYYFSYEILGGYILLITWNEIDEMLGYVGPYGKGEDNWIHGNKPLGDSFQRWKLIDTGIVTDLPRPQESGNITLSVSGKEVCLQGVEEETIEIHTIEGKFVTRTQNTCFTLPQGFYILKAGPETFKAIIK
ncbi:MAG: Ig-like domain-containing protein [Candidatus Azobacteroides sp.]|nr:Ig-like domain-containing protein [Candidatus Azobacteroides sp.]